jgi:polyether ionophore transport system permease protein
MNAAGTAAPAMKRFWAPRTIISRLTFRHTVRSAALWGIIFGAYMASKVISFVNAYPTVASRQGFAASFGGNVGIELLLGPARQLQLVTGYTTWNIMGVVVMVGAIWAFLLATKTFRGEEDAGRTELLLAGQTTATRAATNTLVGLGASLVVFYGLFASAAILIGKDHNVGFSPHAALFFALAASLGAILFAAIGALASQLMPTRARAASLSAAVFGVFFLIRGIADATNTAWLVNFSPLGWIEKLQPLYNSQPIWLVPIVGLIVVLLAATIFFASRRDLGDSIFADKDTAKPRTALLKTPLTAAIRLTRVVNLSWLIAIGLVATVYGLFTKSAAQAFSQSASLEHALDRLAQQSPATGAVIFLGVVFFLQMIFMMAYAASSVAAIRKDEANGYLDNLLVRPVSRQRWLWGRLLLTTTVIVLAGMLTTVCVWIGVVSQHVGVSFPTLFTAGVNAVTPALFVIGAGVFIFGIQPRLTTVLVYSVIAWSFLVEMLSSGLSLSHWILDTSVIHQLALAPASAVDWTTAGTLVALGLLLAVLGAWRFNGRDLEGE